MQKKTDPAIEYEKRAKQTELINREAEMKKLTKERDSLLIELKQLQKKKFELETEIKKKEALLKKDEEGITIGAAENKKLKRVLDALRFGKRI